MTTSVPLPTISYTAGMLAGIAFCVRVYSSYRKDKKPYTLYFLVSIINWTILAAMKGLAPIFFPNNIKFWELLDSFSYIVIALAIAYGYRFLLALNRNKWANHLFYLSLAICLGFTPLDFIYTNTAEIVPPGIIAWNDHPVLAGVFAVMMAGVIVLSIFFFLTRTALKSFLVQLRLALFIIFYGFIGFGGILLFVTPNPFLLLVAHFSIAIGSLAMFLVTIVHFFEKHQNK